MRTSGSPSSVAATARMSSASAASPRHNAVSAVRAGWSAPGRAVPLDGSRALRGRAGGSGDEAIAAPRYGLDVARLFRVVVERRTHFADRRLEHRLGHEPMAPDGVEQGVLGHQRARRARQRAEHGERLRGEGYGLAGARQPCFGFIQFEPVEAQARTRQIRFHRGTKHRSLHSGWIKGLATPAALFRGGGRKGTRVPGLPWRGRRDHDASLGACRSHYHCAEVHR